VIGVERAVRLVGRRMVRPVTPRGPPLDARTEIGNTGVVKTTGTTRTAAHQPMPDVSVRAGEADVGQRAIIQGA